MDKETGALAEQSQILAQDVLTATFGAPFTFLERLRVFFLGRGVISEVKLQVVAIGSPSATAVVLRCVGSQYGRQLVKFKKSKVPVVEIPAMPHKSATSEPSNGSTPPGEAASQNRAHLDLIEE